MKRFCRLLCCLLWCVTVAARGSADEARQAIIECMFELPELSLAALEPKGAPAFDFVQAERNGLHRTNLPSFGSGLDISATGEWFGLTDRGPNAELVGPDGRTRRVLPLPQFAPGIAVLRTNRGTLQFVRYIPLRDAAGRPLTGLGNSNADEPGFASATAPESLAPDPGGLDPEGLRCLPDGGFLVSDEYAPSVARVDSNGRVVWRLVPKGHNLAAAPYPVRAILPAAVRARRDNRGFENLALSGDARLAYLALQSPAVPENHPRSRSSRIVRVVEVDLSDRDQPCVTGHFLARMGSVAEHPGTKSQAVLKWNDAVWLGPRRLLVLEQGRTSAVLREIDLTLATNLLGHAREDDPQLDAEDPGALAGLNVAESRLIARIDEVSRQGGHKLEGLCALGAGRYAVANDNDFGIGENAAGIPTRIWIVRLP
ncbi:MAG: esterase-like activity of phytase family protein [Verrucomicrobiales bacterium]|nr:esterase-like activity of phytase family protein [Verrucomicrobiales bacterium]